MQVAIQIVFLVWSLCVLQQFVTHKIYSSSHRLLTIVLTLSALYNFYLSVEACTGRPQVFGLLKGLLLIQALYAMIHYVMEIMHQQYRIIQEICFFLLLLFMDYMMFASFGTETYVYVEMLFSIAFVIFYLSSGIKLIKKNKFRGQEKKVRVIIYMAFLVPMIALSTHSFGEAVFNYIMPASLAVTNAIIYYLILTGQIFDVASYLKGQVYDTSDTPTVLFDEQLCYIESNQSAEQLFSEEFMAHRGLDSNKDYSDELKELMEHDDEMAIHGGYYRIHIEPELLKGRKKGYVLRAVDITSYKKENEILEQKRKFAEEESVNKSRFLAKMSHDLRSPLHAILGLSEILGEKKEISGKNRFLISQINASGRVLLERVNAILDFSKLETGKLELAKVNYSFEKIVENIIYQSMVNLHEKNVELKVFYETEIPEELIGDAMRIQSIFQNLLSNAVKFTDEGHIYVKISCEKADDGRVKICCIVEDTGRGMTKEQQQLIFEEYKSFAADSKIEGSGLGLNVIKQLVEMMDGNIRAESDGESGSCFYMDFYQDIGNAEWKQGYSYTGKSLSGRSTHKPKKIKPDYIYPTAKVLVVDDMKVNLQVFRLLVAPWKLLVDCAENGKSAVEKAKETDYDLIFMDYMMPEMSGLEAARKIKEFSNTPVIMLTADLSDELRRQYVQYQISDFLSKPLEVKHLKKALDTYIPDDKREISMYSLDMETDMQSAQTSLRTLVTFVEEVGPLAQELMELSKRDLNLFRIKVHGIKGSARLIGREELGEQAEILEMAAKTENSRFISRHIEDFIELLKEELLNVKNEIDAKSAGINENELKKSKSADAVSADVIAEQPDEMQEKSDNHMTNNGIKDNGTRQSEVSDDMLSDTENAESLVEYLSGIKEGFESYDQQMIENAVAKLKSSKLYEALSEDKKTKIEEIENLCENFDFDEGSELVDVMLNSLKNEV